MTGTLMAQPPTVAPLMSKDLPDLPGREVLMITVKYPPGGTDPIHRHNAHAFVYVMEGSIVMQVKGGKADSNGQFQLEASDFVGS